MSVERAPIRRVRSASDVCGRNRQISSITGAALPSSEMMMVGGSAGTVKTGPVYAVNDDDAMTLVMSASRR